MKILLVIALLITYGSIYPGNFTDAGPDALAEFLADRKWVTSLGDLLGNTALFAPFGFIGGWITANARDRNYRLILLLASGFTLSFILQILQIWLPTRSAAMADVVWNMVGMLGGLGLSLIARRYAWSWLTTLPSLGPQTIVPVTLILLWLFSELLPLVPALDWQQFKDAVKPLQVFDFSFPAAWLHAAGLLTIATLVNLITARPIIWLTTIVLFVLAGKIVIIDQVLDTPTTTGLLTGYLVSLVLLQNQPRIMPMVAFWSLWSAWTLHALTPFVYMPGGAFSLLPFATMLEGSMRTNATALTLSLFIYSALLWLAAHLGGNFRGIFLGLLVWSILIELTQMALLGRTADITEPLLIGLIAWVFMELKRIESRYPVRYPAFRAAAPATATPPRGQSAYIRSKPNLHDWPPLILIIVATTGTFWLILRLPGIPYNLKELFLFDGNPLFILIFVLALLWIGLGAAWVSDKQLSSKRPYISLPSWAFLASLISIGLLSISVTQESIADIAGSNNLYWFVTNRDIWGESWRHIFEWVGPTFVSTLERPVRYTALYMPLLIFLVIILCLLHLHSQGKLHPKRGLVLITSALPWLWLAKGIAFDWSSTDNLNELIAREGALGMGGGFYLYLLLFVLCLNAVIFSRAIGHGTHLIYAMLLSAMLLPVGWWLLTLGLEPEVQKYSHTFSGAQFLLGPDRKQLLSEMELFMRWCLVQGGFILIVGTGIHSYQKMKSLYFSKNAT